MYDFHPMNTPPCALCLEPKPLANSHIIPDFYLRKIADQLPVGRSQQTQPHLSWYDMRDFDLVERARKRTLEKRLGFVQPLLCHDCEGKLSKGETHVRETLYGKAEDFLHSRPFRTRRSYQGDTWSGSEERIVNYKLFKQFQIGLFWKCCVASGTAFQGFTVDAALQEQMRSALHKDSYPEQLVPCLMRKMQGDAKVWFGHVQLPTGMGEGVYNIFLGGYRWQFFVERRPEDPITLTKVGWLKMEVVGP